MSRQSVSFSDELDIRSPELVPLVCYPRFSESEYSDRIAEMESLGVTSIALGGRTTINGVRVAGKGQVGLVLRAKIGNKTCALKIRRLDADRKSMDEEARLHRIANGAGVGPRLEGHSKNLVAMEFVDGQSIVDWVGNAPKGKLRRMARSVLEQCYSLDRAGLDHGELSRLNRHVIVAGNPYIIDFESASTARKTSNVTAAAQSIFLHGAVAGMVQKTLQANREKALLALKIYKRGQTRANFDAVLDSLPV
ncbi:MAG TPA: RIO1 family regulatory kinase/ATPase [Nitrososphaera sp.]|nr:RIO1 family regulatory kinase/ATPase [Nitrososphaera sp.]